LRDLLVIVRRAAGGLEQALTAETALPVVDDLLVVYIGGDFTP
jgi:hypothetical protein